MKHTFISSSHFKGGIIHTCTYRTYVLCVTHPVHPHMNTVLCIVHQDMCISFVQHVNNSIHMYSHMYAQYVVKSRAVQLYIGIYFR